VIVGAFVTTLVTGPSGLAQEPPFGLQSGDELISLPKASQISEMGNIATLFYEQDHLPAGFRDVEQIALKLCKKSGLQQAISASRVLSGEDARRQFASAYAEAARRYGRPDDGDPERGTASGSKARVAMFARLAEPGFYRVFIVQCRGRA
jgi:hypothetical protein